ncbi:SDR family oxidoreductase [Candidatus Sumerlaeota bacterium]|nr:SDR family oxidoreductase [Candidatus Sumerlaeota bacterium]
MNLLILGANSDIAMAAAHEFAAHEGATILLASRDVERLERKAKDLEIRHQIQARVLPFDAVDYASHAAFYEALDPKPDGVILAFGYLGDQASAQRDWGEARRIIESNYTGAVSILEIIAADFEQKGRGFIIGISSVAGVRGRQSNYIYGSAKAGLKEYLSGLRQRLFKCGVHVMTVLPGFTRTAMTEGMDLPARLTAEPEDVGRDIYRAWRKRRRVIYSRWFWRCIMHIIRHVPEFVFVRTKL